MSPRERAAWSRLAVLLVVFVPYFGLVADRLSGGGAVGRPLLLSLIGTVVIYALLSACTQLALLAAYGRDFGDERDAAIDAFSLRVAYYALISLLLGALGVVALLALLQPPSAQGTILLPTFSVASQYALLSSVVAEALRHATQVVCQRRQAIT